MLIKYRNIEIGSRRVDFLVEDLVSVEIEAISILKPVHLAQAINYLASPSASLWRPVEAYNLEVGLLVNFGAEKLEFKRLFNKKFSPPSD